MNHKYVAIALVVIIIVASAMGYLAYKGAFSDSSNTSPTPAPTTTASPSPTPVPTPTTTLTPTASPTTTATPTPTASPTPQPTPTPQPITLTIFAASSLTNVIANMTQAFDKEYNCNIVVNSGSSSTLEAQIAAGSPCDVFMSADTKWTNTLNSSSLIYNNFNTNFTTNSLCVILAQGNPKNIKSLADLASTATGADKIHIVIAQTSVPVGSYTNQTLTKINNTWGNPSSPNYINNGSYLNYYTNFQNNVINTLQTDEQVVGAVNLNVGVADAGIVFYSDEVYANMIGTTVQFLSIPSSVNTVGTYGICIPSETAQPTVAQEFYNYWLSSQGQALLTEFGFGF
jgi:molybdate transport system substrate-binding protein